MEFAGTIEAPHDPPGIDKAAWIELISAREDLFPAEPREGINPFTREPIMFSPRPDCARLVVNGKDIGWISWAQNEDNLLTVSGELPVVKSHAEDIAASLGGTFKPWEESET